MRYQKENYLIQSEEIEKPIDWRGAKVLADFNGNFQPKISIETLTFVNESLNKIKKHISEGRIFEGMDLQINVTDEELVNIISSSKVVVYLSHLEPFGLVPLESMSCGTPVVAVKEGGLRESIIHGKNGFLVERDENDVAEAISEILLISERFEEMSKFCMEFTQQFWKWEAATDRLLNVVLPFLNK